MKLVDPSNRNVWWWHRDAFEFPADWQPLRIRSSEVTFAWGPAGGGPLRELGAIEIAIAAGPGGRGTRLDRGPALRGPHAARAAARRAHRARRPDIRPEHALDGDAATSWRSEPGAAPQWLALDFRARARVRRARRSTGRRAASRARSKCRPATTASTWTDALVGARRPRARAATSTCRAARARGTCGVLAARAAPAATGFAIASLRVEPFEFSRSLARLLPRRRRARAARAAPALAPPRADLLDTGRCRRRRRPRRSCNEEGMVEPDRGSFSLEPFLFARRRARHLGRRRGRRTRSRRACLPIPSSRLALARSHARRRPRSRRGDGGARVRARPLPRRERRSRRAARAPVRGAAPVPGHAAVAVVPGHGRHEPDPRARVATDGAVAVNGRKRRGSARPAERIRRGGVRAGRRRSATSRAASCRRDAQVRDDFAHASGALCWDLELAAGRGARGGARGAVRRAAAPDACDAEALRRSARASPLEAVERAWQTRLGAVAIRVGARIRRASTRCAPRPRTSW